MVLLAGGILADGATAVEVPVLQYCYFPHFFSNKEESDTGMKSVSRGRIG